MSVEDHTQIHALYCSLTGRDLPLDMALHLGWNSWKAKGHTEADLRLVVDHIKSLIKAGRRFPESMRFYNLIMNVDRFSEDLAEARALARISRTNPGKASVLKATGRPCDPPGSPARTPEQIMRADKELKRLLDLRDNL